MTLQELNERFAIPGVVDFQTGAGGLTRLAVTAAGGEAHIYTQGAHVTHFQPAGAEPVLWMSERSWFEPGKPLRGGVPICFPWFGPKADDPGAPAHGFARLLEWDVFDVSQEDQEVYVTFMLAADERTRQHWPGTFALRYTVCVSHDLTLTLETLNLDSRPLTYTEALHSYFQVSDIREVRVGGLANTMYEDKVAGGRHKQPASPIRFTGETDRVYLNTRTTCIIEDLAGGRRIKVDKAGSNSTVVWNPWVDKAARMPDFGDDEWQRMVCVETANALDNAVTLRPETSSKLITRIAIAQ